MLYIANYKPGVCPEDVLHELRLNRESYTTASEFSFKLTTFYALAQSQHPSGLRQQARAFS
jgi:hypothetical protein